MKVALKKQTTSLGLRINIKGYCIRFKDTMPTGSLKSRRKDEW